MTERRIRLVGDEMNIVRYCRAVQQSTRVRRTGAALALSAYLVAIVGLPVWEPASTSGERFACQSRRCGCRTAAQCWTSCCCFTLEERIAWARANNAEIPAQALARAATLATGDSPVAKGDSAVAKACGNCCAHKTASAGKQTDSPARKGRVVWVDSVQAQKCRGVAHGWMTLGMPVFPPPRAVSLEIEFQPIGQISLSNVRDISRSDRPATRPG